MAFKKFKHLVSAALSAALAITACVTTVEGENSPFADRITQKLHSHSQTFTGEMGSVNNVVRNPVSVSGLTGSFKGTSYYEQIDEDSQKIYNGIFKEYKDGMRNGEEIELIEYFPEMEFEVTGTVSGGYFYPDDESWEKMDNTIKGYLYPAYLALTTDHPELSWISYCYFSWNYGAKSITSTGKGTYIFPVASVTFVLNSTNIYGTPQAITDAVSKAKDVIGTQETMYEQVKAIHDYLCNTINYNFTAVKKESELPAGYDIGYYQTAYSAFYRIPQDADTELGKSTDKNLTVCAGYARSFKILCDEYNIPCIYVVGYGINNSGSGEAHAWNYVKMDDDKWYGVDATWDDQTQKIYYEYFLAGSDTPGFNTLTFGQSHQESGVWSTDESFVFQYPTLAKEAYDPNNVPEVTTAETTPEPVVTTEETTPAPVITTEETTPAPVITTEETTPAPVITTEETTPAPVITTEETTPAPVITTEETTPEPVVTTAEETAAPEPVVTTEASTTAPEEQSNFDSNVNTGEGAPEVDIDMDKDQLIDAVLSDEEKELLKDGEISIDFNIENIDKTVSDEIKKAVEDCLSKLSQGDYSLGMYLDISLSKTVNGEKSAVTSTNKAIRITISIPENLQNDNRSFGLVRVHDGKSEFLEDLDTDPNTVTFETDKFSAYAVVYSDEKTTDPEPGKDEDQNQNTGFGFENSLIITMIISCAAVFASAVTIYVKSAKSKK